MPDTPSTLSAALLIGFDRSKAALRIVPDLESNSVQLEKVKVPA
jgi:hypothetical protein